MIVLVTPELVAPMNPDQVIGLPGEDLSEPNDFELYFLGQLEGEKVPPQSDALSAVQTETPLQTATRSICPDERGLHGPWGVADAETED